MRRKEFKRAAWCCHILLAAIGLQAATAQAEDASKPNVKKTSKQLEEVIKLLKQGENPNAEASPKEAKEPDKKTKSSKAKNKP